MTTRSSKRKHEASPDEKGKGKAKEIEKEDEKGLLSR